MHTKCLSLFVPARKNTYKVPPRCANTISKCVQVVTRLYEHQKKTHVKIPPGCKYHIQIHRKRHREKMCHKAILIPRKNAYKVPAGLRIPRKKPCKLGPHVEKYYVKMHSRYHKAIGIPRKNVCRCLQAIRVPDKTYAKYSPQFANVM